MKIENKDITLKTKDFDMIIKKRRFKIFKWSIVAFLSITIFTINFHIFIVWPYLEMKHRQTYSFYKDNLTELIYDKEVDRFEKVFDLVNYYENEIYSFIKTYKFDSKTAQEMQLYMFVSYAIIAVINFLILLLCIGRIKVNDLDTTFAEMGELGKTQIVAKIQESLKGGK